MAVTLKQLKGAIRDLNKSGLLKDKILVGKKKQAELAKEFMDEVEKVVTGGLSEKISDSTRDINNALVREEKAAKEKKKKEGKPKPTAKPTKKAAKKEEKKAAKPTKKGVKGEPRADSRPGVLFASMKKGKDLDKCLKDKTVLAKYNDVKSWIKNDYERLVPRLPK